MGSVLLTLVGVPLLTWVSCPPPRSSRSTRLTVDLVSLQSTCAASGQAPSTSTGCPSYSMLSSNCPSPSYCPSPEQQEVLESSQEVTRYLELRPRVER